MDLTRRRKSTGRRIHVLKEHCLTVIRRHVRSDHLLKVGTCLEAHGLACLDLHRLAGAGVERLAGLGLVDGERPEGRQREPALLFQLGDNGPDKVIGGLGGGNASAVQRVLKNGGDEGFAHAGRIRVVVDSRKR